MDLENVKRVNDLARSLKDKGIVDTMDQATTMAEQITSRNSQGLQDIRTSDETHPSNNEALQMQVRKLNVQLQDQSKIIADLQHQINGFNRELNQMKQGRLIEPTFERQQPPAQEQQTPLESEPTETPEQPAEPTFESTGQPTVEPVPAQPHQPVEATAPPSEPAPHPKVSTFTSEDVSIEKIFYSGPKDKRPS